jgi:quinol monooxygenase YgiN
MTIKAIVEFTVQPGRRDEFVRRLGSLVAQHGPTMRGAGWHDSTMYAVMGEPNKLVEIAEWESAEAREKAHQSEIMSEFAQVFELLAGPVGAVLVEPLR